MPTFMTAPRATALSSAAPRSAGPSSPVLCVPARPRGHAQDVHPRPPVHARWPNDSRNTHMGSMQQSVAGHPAGVAPSVPISRRPAPLLPGGRSEVIVRYEPRRRLGPVGRDSRAGAPRARRRGDDARLRAYARARVRRDPARARRTALRGMAGCAPGEAGGAVRGDYERLPAEDQLRLGLRSAHERRDAGRATRGRSGTFARPRRTQQHLGRQPRVLQRRGSARLATRRWRARAWLPRRARPRPAGGRPGRRSRGRDAALRGSPRAAAALATGGSGPARSVGAPRLGRRARAALRALASRPPNLPHGRPPGLRAVRLLPARLPARPDLECVAHAGAPREAPPVPLCGRPLRNPLRRTRRRRRGARAPRGRSRAGPIPRRPALPRLRPVLHRAARPRIAGSLRPRRNDARESVLPRPAAPVALVRRRARGAANGALAAVSAPLRPGCLSARRAVPPLHVQSALSREDSAHTAPVLSGGRARGGRTHRGTPGVPALRRLAASVATAATEPGEAADAR